MSEAELNRTPSPRSAELLEVWEERCRQRSTGPEHCSGPEAVYLVNALDPALRRAAVTPALARAARSWGARCDEPADAVGALVCLRDVLIESVGDGAVFIEGTAFVGASTMTSSIPHQSTSEESESTSEAPESTSEGPESMPEPIETASQGEAVAGEPAQGEASPDQGTEPEGPEPTGEDAAPRPITANAVRSVLDQVIIEAVDGAAAALRAEARTDPLTGCANRLALEEQLGRAVHGAVRSGLDVAVAVVDLDGLKSINDTRGHAAGDAALLALVMTLRGGLRDGDTIYRIGGDEFAVVAPFTDAAGAGAMLERAALEGGPAFGWGVASLAGVGNAAAEDPHLLLLAADTDLYVRRRQARRVPARPSRSHVPLVASVAASLTLAGGAAAAVAALGHGTKEGASPPNALRGAPQVGGSITHEGSRPDLTSPGALAPAPSFPTTTTYVVIPPTTLALEARALARDGTAHSALPPATLAPPQRNAQPPSTVTTTGVGLLGPLPTPTTTTTSTTSTTVILGLPSCDVGDDGQVPTTIADPDPTETPGDDAGVSPRCAPAMAFGAQGSSVAGNSSNTSPSPSNP